MNVIPNEGMSFRVMQCHSEGSQGISRPFDYPRGDIFLCPIDIVGLLVYYIPSYLLG